jgi:CspA family cold shock protein
MSEEMTPDEPSRHGTDATKVRLKWFNNPKGFGLVVPENESIDAFLHITTLQRAGVHALGEGASLLCHIMRGPKGAQVTEVVAMIDAGVQPETLNTDAAALDQNDRTLTRLYGSVKWYKPEKGFGFVMADDGLKDVFIHKSCLDRRQLGALEPGTRIVMAVKTVSKGREAVDFEVLDETRTPAGNFTP